jgi:hypothetical protein
VDLLETAKVLQQCQVELVSLRECIDTTTATGRCFLSMMGAIHQMERELRAGRASAKVRGKTGVGRGLMRESWSMPESCMSTPGAPPPCVHDGGWGATDLFRLPCKAESRGAYALSAPARGVFWKTPSGYEKGWT